MSTPLVTQFSAHRSQESSALPPWRRVRLNTDIHTCIMEHVYYRADILHCRLACKEFERLAAVQLLRHCDIGLRRAEHVRSFRNFMFAYDRRTCAAIHVPHGSARAESEGKTTVAVAVPRRFYFLVGQVTLAVGHDDLAEDLAERLNDGSLGVRDALEQVFDSAKKLTCLAVRDVDAVLSFAPSLLAKWQALPALRVLAVDYRRVGSGSGPSTLAPEVRESAPEWKSDWMLRHERGVEFAHVTHLYLHAGEKDVLEVLAPWMQACKGTQSLHIASGDDESHGTPLQVRPLAPSSVWLVGETAEEADFVWVWDGQDPATRRSAEKPKPLPTVTLHFRYGGAKGALEELGGQDLRIVQPGTWFEDEDRLPHESYPVEGPAVGEMSD